MITPYIYLLGFSMGVGIMANLRKYYQSIAGSNLVATLTFSAISAFVAFLIGRIYNGAIHFDLVLTILATGYAAISTITAILCIVASKYGSVSSAILYGSMGTLVLPSCFGIFFDPEDVLTIAKVIGFLFASAALFVGFRKANTNKTENEKTKYLHLAIFFSNGMALVVFKAVTLLRPGFHSGNFVTGYMLIAAIASTIILLFVLLSRKQEQNTGTLRSVLSLGSIIAIVAYAVAFYISDSLSIKCTTLIPLTIQAPLSFCLPILCTAILEYLIYRHVLHKDDYLQILFATLCSACFVF